MLILEALDVKGSAGGLCAGGPQELLTSSAQPCLITEDLHKLKTTHTHRFGSCHCKNLQHAHDCKIVCSTHKQCEQTCTSKASVSRKAGCQNTFTLSLSAECHDLPQNKTKRTTDQPKGKTTLPWLHPHHIVFRRVSISLESGLRR